MAMKRRNDSESIIRDIKRKTRRKFSAEEKIRIIFDIIRGDGSIAEICRREGIAPNLYYPLEQGLYGSRKAKATGRYTERG